MCIEVFSLLGNLLYNKHPALVGSLSANLLVFCWGMSSAYMATFSFTDNAILFTYSINSSGLSTKPCAAPIFHYFEVSQLFPPYCLLYVLFLHFVYFLWMTIRLAAFPMIPYLCNLCTRVELHKQSKALDRSRKTLHTFFCSSNALYVCVMKLAIAVKVGVIVIGL